MYYVTTSRPSYAHWDFRHIKYHEQLLPFYSCEVNTYWCHYCCSCRWQAGISEGSSICLLPRLHRLYRRRYHWQQAAPPGERSQERRTTAVLRTTNFMTKRCICSLAYYYVVIRCVLFIVHNYETEVCNGSLHSRVSLVWNECRQNHSTQL